MDLTNHIFNREEFNFGNFYKKPKNLSQEDTNSKNVQILRDDSLTYLVKTKSPEEAIQQIKNQKGSNEVINVRGYNNDEFIGYSNINFREWKPEENKFIARGYISTQQKQRGFSRRLLENTVKELEKYSSEKDVEIVHYVGFLTDVAKSKLPHIYNDLGYKACNDNSNGKEVMRKYRP